MNKKIIIFSMMMCIIPSIGAAPFNLGSRVRNFFNNNKSNDTNSKDENTDNSQQPIMPNLYKDPITCDSHFLLPEQLVQCNRQNTKPPINAIDTKPTVVNDPEEPMQPAPQVHNNVQEEESKTAERSPLSITNKNDTFIEDLNELQVRNQELSALGLVNAHQPKEEKPYEKTWRESAWEHKGKIGIVSAAIVYIIYNFSKSKR